MYRRLAPAIVLTVAACRGGCGETADAKFLRARATEVQRLRAHGRQVSCSNGTLRVTPLAPEAFINQYVPAYIAASGRASTTRRTAPAFGASLPGVRTIAEEFGLTPGQYIEASERLRKKCPGNAFACSCGEMKRALRPGQH